MKCKILFLLVIIAYILIIPSMGRSQQINGLTSIWFNTYSNDSGGFCRGIIDGNDLVISGITSPSYPSGTSDQMITKISSAGNIIFQKVRAPGSDHDGFQAVAKLPNGNYGFFGQQNAQGTQYFDGFYAEFNSLGNEVSYNFFSIPGSSSGSDMLLLPNGNRIYTGNHGNGQNYVALTGPGFNQLNYKTFYVGGWNAAQLGIDAVNSYVYAVGSESSTTSVKIEKYDFSLNSLASFTITNNEAIVNYDILIDGGDILLCGYKLISGQKYGTFYRLNSNGVTTDSYVSTNPSEFTAITKFGDDIILAKSNLSGSNSTLNELIIYRGSGQVTNGLSLNSASPFVPFDLILNSDTLYAVGAEGPGFLIGIPAVEKIQINVQNSPPFPSLTTTAVSNINTISATSGGNITSDGGSPITARGVVWSISPNPTIVLTTKTTDGNGTGTFTSSLTGLTPNTKYYVRAYATNAAGTSYGDEVSFTTKSECLPDYIPTDGLVGYWPFCGNANDESGNGNHGVVNGATLSIDRNGDANSSYNFDGVNDNIFINNNFFNNGWTDWSMTTWYNLNQLQNPNNGNSSHILFNTLPHNGFGFSLNWGNSNKYGFGIGNGTPSTSWNVLFNETSNQNIFVNSWHHIAFLKKGTTYELYVDGVLDKSWPSPSTIASYFYKMYFGAADPSVSNEVINGKMDDVGIWNRALTTQEIQNIYNGCPQAAFVNFPADITLSCPEALSLQTSPASLNYSNNATGNCEISGSVTGVITGTADECGGTFTQTWSYTDEYDRTITHVQGITVSPAPQATWVNAPQDIIITCDAATTLAATTLNYTNNGTGTCLISGSATGVLTGSFTACGGTFTQTWTHMDDCGRSINHTQTITVDAATIPSWVNPPSDVTMSCDEASRFAPASLSITNSGAGSCLLAGSVSPTVSRQYNDCGGTIDTEWKFTDPCGRTITHIQRATVLPKPAVSWVNAPADITISCREAEELAPTFMAYSNGNAGYCIQSGYVLSTLSASQIQCGSTYTQTWTYTDQCNRTITHTQQIQVRLPDSDNDNAPDGTDNCPDTANIAQTDTDTDGVGDACDNCPATANASQSDCNGNGIGDACDAPDADCDGIPNATDNCPDYPNPNQTDLNNNGIGDACETGKRFGINTTSPQSEVHVANGAIYVDNPDKGIILKGADGKCYKLLIIDGSLKTIVVPCPQTSQNN